MRSTIKDECATDGLHQTMSRYFIAGLVFFVAQSRINVLRIDNTNTIDTKFHEEDVPFSIQNVMIVSNCGGLRCSSKDIHN